MTRDLLFWRSEDGLVHVTKGYSGRSSLMECERYVIDHRDQFATESLTEAEAPTTCLRCLAARTHSRSP